jgi:metal-sulfur cluster biosynthetic enzyme/nitrite reductase/ring-hydroxylating ferredoxin subunit
MSKYFKVANVGEIPDPGKQLLEVDDRMVVLFHAFGEYFCIDDVCTHDGGTLGDGEMRGHSIACPRHGAQFDIRNGKAMTMPATEDTVSHHVKVEGDGIYVRINEDGDDAPPAPSPTSSAATTASSEFASASTDAPASTDDSVASSATDESANAETFSLSEDGIREELKKVIDPELFVNIVDLGLIYGIDIQEAEEQVNISIDMTMTSPACPAGPQLIANCRQVVGQLPGVKEVEVKIVMDPPWTPDKMTDDAKDQLGIF